MRFILYLIWIALIVLGASFAILNSHSVLVNYFIGQKNIYFPLLSLLLIFVGVLLGVIAMLPLVIKLKMRNK